MTQEIEQSLLESIEELGGDSDYRHPCSGYKQELYLNPETYTLYVFEHVGAGTPMRAWHGIDKWILDIPDRAIPESLVEVLKRKLGNLVETCERFEGTKWDGSNHRGVWRSDDEYGVDASFDHMDFDIACYWDPSDWFGDADDEIRRLASEGLTPEQIADKLYLGDTMDGMCKRDEAIDYIETQLEYFETSRTIAEV